MSVMTLSELRVAAPAIFAETNLMTPRYAQIKTADILSRMADAGYLPVQAKQDNPTRRDPRFVTHRVVLRHERHIGEQNLVGAQVPQIALVNSHNGRTQLKLFAGFYRFVCANGLVVGNDTFRASVPHFGDAAAEAVAIADTITDRLHEINGTIERWSQIELTPHRANEFARRAAVLRFGEFNAKQYEPRALLEARREEDEGRTLWRVYNVVQENTTKGGIAGTTALGRRVITRALNAINVDMQYNSQLWNLAEEFAEVV